ncbi:MAG TPA: hypothetical protein DD856_12190 [Sulfobacillus sp.]|nr:hypothetical protein [Sulfobacillus sp.]
METLQTHRVMEEKAATMGLSWIELLATQVLADPFTWHVVQEGRLHPWGYKGSQDRKRGRLMPTPFGHLSEWHTSLARTILCELYG